MDQPLLETIVTLLLPTSRFETCCLYVAPISEVAAQVGMPSSQELSQKSHQDFVHQWHPTPDTKYSPFTIIWSALMICLLSCKRTTFNYCLQNVVELMESMKVGAYQGFR